MEQTKRIKIRRMNNENINKKGERNDIKGTRILH